MSAGGEQSAEYVVKLTDAERIAISAVVHQNYYMPDVFAVVEKIIAERGDTTIEWNVQSASGLSFGHHGTTEESARTTLAKSSRGRTLMSRKRITFPDLTTDWKPVNRPGTADGESDG